MSGLFYVFLKWTKAADNNASAKHGRYLLTFSSRYEADELFRDLKDLQSGNRHLFPVLIRTSAQFWCYDSPESWESILRFQMRNDLPQFKNTFMTQLLPNGDGNSTWPIIQNPELGPDWISGGEYFIRNRRQPNLYWYVWANQIRTSVSRRTKFCITRTGTFSDADRAPVVLVRLDKVSVRAVAETLTPGAINPDNRKYVSVSERPTNHLEMSAKDTHWEFGTLVNKVVGVMWDTCSDATWESEVPLVTYMPGGGGDEWELV
ncbi:hypothetical protein BZA05DRAFT_412418 [Tricharina praecox]|uniref:uncharacterized protein n=1 Tax=Tricharina praecox TaxID=43433 RepID=UPI00221F45FE|nr:uncharacterized protein BZA05DRAFT_412418 [Tricharina praecox]KAI5842236.1 hypothetical protein BZA05DRAFT_412418 [Tricharina praecox]